MGFAQEIKDFLSGYQTVTDISRKNRAMDQDDKKMAADEKYRQDQLQLQKDQLAETAAYHKGALANAAARAGSTATADPEITLNSPYDTEDVEGYAAGGAVEEDESGPTAIPDRVAIDLPTDNAKAAAARAAGKRSYTNDKGELVPLYSMSGAVRNTYADAVKAPPDASTAINAAMRGFATRAAANGAVGGTKSKVDFATGEGAATPADIKQIDKTIDPDGTMKPWELGAARLQRTYDFYIKQGNPQKAAEVAQSILLYDKMKVEARGALATQLIQGGKSFDAARVIADGFNESIHNGQVMEVAQSPDGRVMYRVSQGGKIIDEGVAGPKELMQIAANAGQTFTTETAKVAATKDPKPAGPTEPGASAPAAPTAATPTGAIPDAAPAPAATANPAPAATATTPTGAIPETAPPASYIPESANKPAPKAAIDPRSNEVPVPAGALDYRVSKTGKVKRDYPWAVNQYKYAVSAEKYWEDKLATSTDPSVKQMYQDKLAKAKSLTKLARDDAWALRTSKMSKKADPNAAFSQFAKDMDKIYEDAAPLTEEPRRRVTKAVPPPGLVPGSKEYADWALKAATEGQVLPDAPNSKHVQQRKMTPQELAYAQKQIASGIDRQRVIQLLLQAGIDPEGL